MTSHLFVDISAHGFGHLAQAAPILNELVRRQPGLRLTVRSGLPEDKLRARLHGEFTHIAQRSDFGFVMQDAVRIDYAQTAQAYRDFHADWPQRVAEEAAFLSALCPGLVLTDVAYLPLAGAAEVGIPAVAMCSLNWADLFQHFFGREPWAAPIHAQILAAYRSAECFLRLTPAMPMAELPQVRILAPVAAVGQERRRELRRQLRCRPDEKRVLVAFGGVDKDLTLDRWPRNAGLRWLIPQSWPIARDDMVAVEPLGVHFPDLLASVDAVITKPGYGTFTEAACNGIPVLYVRRDDWPEQDCLIAWLKHNARCREIGEAELMSGCLYPALAELWRQPVPPRPRPDGTAQAAALLSERLTCRN